MAWSIFTDGGGNDVAVAWAQQFLTKINAPVTPGNTEFVYQWMKSEGGGGKYNPLNTGSVYNRPDLTTTGSQYGGGANDFASWDAGLIGSAINVQTPGPDNYPAIVNALRSDNPAGARQALWSSGWAASHYGYGTNWSNAALPGSSGNVIPASYFSSSATGKGVDCTLVWPASSAMYKACVAANKVAGQDEHGNPLPGGAPKSGASSDVISIGGITILTKSQARAVIGAGVLVSGGILMTLGFLALMKSVSAQTGAGRVVTELPVIGRGVRAAGRVTGQYT
jgi:hypothetical protein